MNEYLNLQNGGLQINDPNVANFVKAMQTDPSTAGVNAPSTAGSIDPFKQESVSDIVTSIVAQEQDVKFTNLLPVDYTPTHFYQYLRESGLGGQSIWGSMASQFGTILEQGYPTTDRQVIPLKFSYDSKSVSLAAQNDLYYAIKNPFDYLARKAILSMMIRENKLYLFGNQAIDSLQFDGIFQAHKIRSGAYLTPYAYSQLEQVMDLRGAKLTYDYISDGENRLFRNYARNARKALIMPTLSIEGVSSKDFGATPMRFIVDPTLGNKTVYDDSLGAIKTKAGRTVQFFTDLFISRSQVFGIYGINDVNQAVSSYAPAMPLTGTNSAVDDSTYTLWDTATYGSYYYGVSALNSYGMSKITLIDTTPVTTSSGKSVELSFTTGAGTYADTGYVIWRSEKNAADATGLFYPLFTVTVAEKLAGYDGGGATKVYDRNRTLPNTEDCFMIGMENNMDILDKEVVRRVELRTPYLEGIKRFDIPVGYGNIAGGQPSMSTLVCHHLALALAAPTKVLVFRNVAPN